MGSNNASRQLLRHGLHFHRNEPIKSKSSASDKNVKQPIPNHRLFGNVGPWATMDFSKGSKDPVKFI